MEIVAWNTLASISLLMTVVIEGSMIWGSKYYRNFRLSPPPLRRGEGELRGALQPGILFNILHAIWLLSMVTSETIICCNNYKLKPRALINYLNQYLFTDTWCILTIKLSSQEFLLSINKIPASMYVQITNLTRWYHYRPSLQSSRECLPEERGGVRMGGGGSTQHLRGHILHW